MADDNRTQKQAGFALITVLLVVAIVSIIAAQLVYQQALDIQRAETRLNQAQSLAVANGLEAWVKKGLKLDASLNKIDHLGEQWAQPMMPIPFAGGQVAGRLEDLQGRFNVNNLAETDEQKAKLWQQIAQRLLRNAQLPIELAEVLADWVDADNNARLMGAESDFYLLKNPAYRAGNQPLAQLEELALLKGFTPAIRKQLAPALSALPKITKININTAPKPVLLALADWMTPEIAQAWLDKRLLKPADKVDAFRSFLAAEAGFQLQEIKTALPDSIISVETEFFLLVGQFDYGSVQQQVDALLHRESSKKVTLWQRWFSQVKDE
ncbi:hypothetical protein CYQ88_00985 [Hydrogenovibrio sp. SC-1]|uniref:type II secretion system minor pseudopilin GspK n=1 Tax=Hydrogenovibrio sp. SC-1 TaxID=2065820 RepID=UPI000C7C124E|nr:type II secretion system minor pseudopilin GspK [Hydrogenovibrio sp. SC-1]PLA75571.1 hypothetical protein CYQ88_00985 [Hydrogenovibrio sp. SC-1]